MKTNRILALGLLLVAHFSYAQTVRHSTHVEDQIVQGPCYTFALVAALESNALENEPNLQANQINFNEWRFYSDCVVPRGIAWAGVNQIEYSLDHAYAYGATSGTHPIPTSFDCPNPNDPQIPCFAEFSCSQNDTWCQGNAMYGSSNVLGGLGGGCEDDEGTLFEFGLGLPHSYQLQGNANDLFERNNSPTPTYISQQLSLGRGVVAIFDNYLGSGIQHAVFIYSKSGNNYSYKDSWPLNPGIKSGALMSNGSIVRTYVVKGTMVGPPVGIGGNPGNGGGTNTPCDYSISGPSTLNSSDTYSLTGGTGGISNIQWSISGAVNTPSNMTTSSITLTNSNCGAGQTRTLTVTYTNQGQSCTKTKQISIPGTSTPSIQINGPSSLSLACPNSAIQLEAVSASNTNPAATTNFQWTVSGANILNGQGTKYLNIHLWNNPGQFQQYRLRAQKAGCSWTAWHTVTGYIGPD
ncbi:MAG TPA: hypothetical protein DCE41_00860, partial [Cytophagales bacterium]|nr:hypothetical protein [Cytophagales bacterium]